MSAINRVVLTGGLTRDPELRHTPDGTPVITLRLGFTTVHHVQAEWRERRNYIDVEAWGAQAEDAAKYLARGRQIAVDGRLQWSEYERSDGRRRQLHRIVAENIQYLPGGGSADGHQDDRASAQEPSAANQAQSDAIPF